ncbi:MAG: DUF2298 domain-containing protein, partial [Dehalococcoidia bacterium]
MLDFIAWWISIEVLGLIVVPMALLLFPSLPDRGYAFTKPLGLLLAGYLFWLVGLTGLLPNSRWTIALVVLVLALVSAFILRRHWQSLLGHLYRERWMFLVTEVLFLGAFAVWAVVRSYDAAIDHTEQPMDFAFLNASLRADDFPPRDPWLSGNNVSYYYFGYLISAGIAKVTGVPGSVAYNLAIALLFALTAVAAFGLVTNLIRHYRGHARAGLRAPIGFGLLGALFVVGIGNLEAALESVRSLGLGWGGFWDWLKIKGLSGAAEGSSLYPDDRWWWWR